MYWEFKSITLFVFDGGVIGKWSKSDLTIRVGTYVDIDSFIRETFSMLTLTSEYDAFYQVIIQ